MNIDLTPKQYLALIKLMNLANAIIINPPDLNREFLDLESYILSFYEDFGLKETDTTKNKGKLRLSYNFLNKYNLREILEENTNNALYIKLAILFASRDLDEKYKDKPLSEKSLEMFGSLVQKYVKEFEENDFGNLYIKSSNVIPLLREVQEKTIDESGEFVDKNHPIRTQYNEFIDNPPYDIEKAIKKLKYFIQKDPYFFDSYLALHELYYENGMRKKAAEILNEGYQKALGYLKDIEGNLPKKLRWGFIENRHIIRILVNQSMALWEKKKTEEALELFRTILKLNPQDNVGARYYILAIRMNTPFGEFQNRFDKGGYYDASINEWFSANSNSFPDEFKWWEEQN
jgi:tetratricopeptide (TPR) repeat protein